MFVQIYFSPTHWYAVAAFNFLVALRKRSFFSANSVYPAFLPAFLLAEAQRCLFRKIMTENHDRRKENQDSLSLVTKLQVLAFALRGTSEGGCLYQHLALLAAARMVGVGEFEQFDGRAVFDYERDADAVGRAVGRN
jgi:hypothetical protein